MFVCICPNLSMRLENRIAAATPLQDVVPPNQGAISDVARHYSDWDGNLQPRQLALLVRWRAQAESHIAGIEARRLMFA